MENKKKVKETEIDDISLTAHQLKKPLSSIRLSLEMLFKEDFGTLNTEQKDIIEKIMQKNESLIFLVNDLLNITKNKEKKQIYNLSPVDIEDLIESLMKLEKEEIINKKIEFKLEMSQNLPKVKMDREKIFIALQNIFDNAIKYTPYGGKITISVRENENNLEIKIQDSGMGIPLNQKEKIFGKFFRADNAYKIETTGSGLGLFIVKDIIEAHYGKVSFISEENKGTTFTVVLPIR